MSCLFRLRTLRKSFVCIQLVLQRVHHIHGVQPQLSIERAQLATATLLKRGEEKTPSADKSQGFSLGRGGTHSPLFILCLCFKLHRRVELNYPTGKQGLLSASAERHFPPCVEYSRGERAPIKPSVIPAAHSRLWKQPGRPGQSVPGFNSGFAA